MEGEEELSLEDILDQVIDIYPEALSLTQPAPESIPDLIKTLSVVAFAINVQSLQDFGGPNIAPRDRALVEQAIAAAYQTYGDFEPYPHPFHKAAVIMRGIVQDHPFGDGNKRTAFLMVVMYLTKAGYPLPDEFSYKNTMDFVGAISRGDIRHPMLIAQKLGELWRIEVPKE